MNKEMKKDLIKTKRLIIRKFLVNDFKDLFEYLSDIEIYRFEPGSPINIEMANILCKERSKDNKYLAVVLKNKVIGHIYFSQIEPKELMTWETGYIFNRKYQKNGFATESLKAVIEYGFKYLYVHKIIAHCNPKNISSWKLLERVNMKREGKLRKNIYFRKDNKGYPIWLDTYEYGILKEER